MGLDKLGLWLAESFNQFLQMWTSVLKALTAATPTLTVQTLSGASSVAVVLATLEMVSPHAVVRKTHSQTNRSYFSSDSECKWLSGAQSDYHIELTYSWLPFFLTDIDECFLGAYTCEVNTDCVNTVGSYDCVCSDGFTGYRNNCMSMCNKQL